jgi:hypothetical protein
MDCPAPAIHPNNPLLKGFVCGCSHSFTVQGTDNQ